VTDPFVAEIRIVGFNFPPTGWAFCNGQILPISQNTALFSLLGTTYGGNGSSTFALPNLQDSAPMHPGQGPGLSLRDLGETGGSQTVTLLATEMPLHTHGLNGSNDESEFDGNPSPTGRVGGTVEGGKEIYGTATGLTPLSPNAVAAAGGSLPHNNMHPYLGLNFVIALQGIFPPRP